MAFNLDRDGFSVSKYGVQLVGTVTGYAPEPGSNEMRFILNESVEYNLRVNVTLSLDLS